jgi:putrescine aminotransferase
VRAVRGRGLLLGIELGPTQSGLLGRLGKKAIEKVSEAVFGPWLAVRLLEEGILAQPASQAWNVLRLEPPLMVSEEQADRAVDTIARILREYDELAPLLADVSKRLGRQALTGWGFG